MFDRIKDGMYWDRAWKLVEGCTPVSEGCHNCWSSRETYMRSQHPNAKIRERNVGLNWKAAPHFFNSKIRLREDNLGLPLLVKKPTAFAIWNDLFHEDVPWGFIDMVHTAMWKASQHLFFVLTKRPERMLDYMAGKGGPNTPNLKPLPNVWLGVTAENQGQADKRIPILLQIPAAKRYVSIEPMLGPVYLNAVWAKLPSGGKTLWNSLAALAGRPALDWIICGGESGPGARPMHPDWVRSLRDQCQAAGVPFFLKQMHVEGKLIKAPMLDGKRYLELPREDTA